MAENKQNGEIMEETKDNAEAGMCNESTEGRKDDDGKLRYDLIPPEALEALARILTDGCKTYGARNWEQGITWGRVFGALMRHAWAWWWGIENDKKSGLPHLEHAFCNLAFLVTYRARRIGTDDRSKLFEHRQEEQDPLSGHWLEASNTSGYIGLRRKKGE